MQPTSIVCPGEEVKARFVSGHPRNDLKLGETFLTVEKYDGSEWVPILTDDDWETEFEWFRKYLAQSEVEIRWFVPENQEPGTYRITHYGNRKSFFSIVHPYHGSTNEFNVTSTDQCQRVDDP